MVIAALLLVAIASCRDTSKSAEQSTQVAQSEAVTQQAAKDLLPAAPSSPVLDMVGVLSDEGMKEITEKTIELDSLKLAQVAVVIIDDLKGMKAINYATALGNKWGVGHKDTNDGITIVVKPKTDDAKGEAAIATGKGMEKILTNEVCQLIIDQEMIPEFKKNDYGKAIEEALDKIKEILALQDESKLEILD